MFIEIKNKADLENTVGKVIASRLVKDVREDGWKRLPRSINFVESKPKFYLGDGDGLYAYGMELSTGKITGSRYCGSGDSAINYSAEQFSEGQTTPEGHALLFVHRYWNGRNSSWTVTIVTKDFRKQFDSKL